MYRIIALLSLIFIPLQLLFAQSPAVSVPLTLSDSVGISTTLYFGLDPTATDGLDTKLNEQSLPPLPPSGAFDARLLLPSGTDASQRDYRNGTAEFDGSITYELQFQPSAGSYIAIAYALPAGISAILQDEVTGTIINAALSGTGKYRVANATVLNRLKLIVSYSLDKVIPEAPVPLYPVNNAANEPVDENFVWLKAANASSYILDISKYSDFRTNVFHDSTLTDTTIKVKGFALGATYYWRVTAANGLERSVASQVFSFTTGPTAVRTQHSNIPDKFSLEANFPNPFNPATEISYSLPQAGFVSLKVYDILGNLVAQLVNETKAAGYHHVRFDAGKLQSGVYIARIEVKSALQSFIQVRKMVYLK